MTFCSPTPADSRSSLEEVLINSPVDDVTPIDDGRKEKLYIQFTAYFISVTKERQANSFHYQMLSKGSKTVLQYWQTDGCQWADLQSVAVRFFNMATSSAASERNFSTMGFIHSKLRNSLSTKTVEKLVFIKSNMVRSTAVRRTTTIPTRVIRIMLASINVTRNKTMVLIQTGFYSFKPETRFVGRKKSGFYHPWAPLIHILIQFWKEAIYSSRFQ